MVIFTATSKVIQVGFEASVIPTDGVVGYLMSPAELRTLIEQEREACAKIAEFYPVQIGHGPIIAGMIRQRGKEKG